MLTLCCLVLCFQADPTGNLEAVEQHYPLLQSVYDEIVLPDGQINYPKLKANPELQQGLTTFVSSLDQVKPIYIEDFNAKTAFFANAYNAIVLLGVVKAWPIESVSEIAPKFGFFRDQTHAVGGMSLTLDQIEKEWLRPIDPRIHFIINCASRSCPKFQPQVLTKDNVEPIMDQATRDFILDETMNIFDREANRWYLSKIFEWYELDFGRKDGVAAFIQKHHPEIGKWKPKKFMYRDYDWHLNGPAKPQTSDH